jgi:hypothetical protein
MSHASNIPKTLQQINSWRLHIRSMHSDRSGQPWASFYHNCWVSAHFFLTCITHVKISHLVASLPTSRQQVVFALFVPRCQQVWNKLLTTWNNLVDIIRLVARSFQQVRYSHDITILLQPCVVNLVTFLLYHDCIRLVRKPFNILVISWLDQTC